VSRLTIRARRIVILVCIAAGVAELAMEAAGVGGHTVAAVVVPVVGIAAGLIYLWTSRGRS
jgi:hypothetical protein